jgi:hypothetical protein
MADDRLMVNQLGDLRMRFSGKPSSGISPSLSDSREEKVRQAARGPLSSSEKLFTTAIKRSGRSTGDGTLRSICHS